MGIKRITAALAFLGLWSLAAALPAAGAEDWPPLTAEETALKDCPQQPGAPAVFLRREVTTDHREYSTSVFCRLKVLTPAGRERANVEIPFVMGSSKVGRLSARVVRPDGTSVDFKGEVFEKTAIRAGGWKVKVKTFALPDVDVGSIIDYRYKLVTDEGRGASKRSLAALEENLGASGKPQEGGIASDSDVLFLPVDVWNVQEDLFTYKAKFTYVVSTDLEIYFAQEKGMQMGYVAHKLIGAGAERREGRIEQEFENVPAFESEELMPPEYSERMFLLLYYIEERVGTERYWEVEGANWQNYAKKFMRTAGAAPAEARQLVAGIDDPLEKLRVLYARAQEIKNLSYDGTLTRRRRAELKIKDNANVADVLRHGYGLRSDITRTFAAMALAAGFEAGVARVVTRDDKLFDQSLCGLYDQFDTELAIVKVGGEEKLFDPATPFCPMGLVRWSCAGSVFLSTLENPPIVRSTPLPSPETALTQRELALSLDAEGNLAGTVKVAFLGQEALVRRVAHIGDDEIEIRKAFETEMTELLPAGAKVTLKSLENIANSADSVVALFDVSLSGFASAAGDRTLLPVSPLLGGRRHPFRHARRKHPIYFPYPSREFDDIVVTLPEGLKIETVPAARRKSPEGLGFSLVTVAEGDAKLHVQRDLVVKKHVFPVFNYPTVKSFFDEVTAGDEELVVLSAVKK